MDRSSPTPARRPPFRALLPVAALALLLAACAPSAAPDPGAPGRGAPAPAVAPTVDPALPPTAAAAERAAVEAWHRMELGRLATGGYTTNVLVDLALPRHVRWTVEEFVLDGSTYRLRFTHDEVSDAVWLVSPAGVERSAA